MFILLMVYGIYRIDRWCKKMAKALFDKLITTSGFISVALTIGFIILSVMGNLTDTYKTLYTMIIAFYFGNDILSDKNNGGVTK